MQRVRCIHSPLSLSSEWSPVRNISAQQKHNTYGYIIDISYGRQEYENTDTCELSKNWMRVTKQ